MLAAGVLVMHVTRFALYRPAAAAWWRSWEARERRRGRYGEETARLQKAVGADTSYRTLPAAELGPLPVPQQPPFGKSGPLFTGYRVPVYLQLKNVPHARADSLVQVCFRFLEGPGFPKSMKFWVEVRRWPRHYVE